MRLNHELSMPRESPIIDGSIERIWFNDDVDDSITEDNVPVDNASIRDETSTHTHQPSHSGTYGNSFLNSIYNTLSTISVTLSVQLLNKCNVLAITDDDVTPSLDWKDLFYFKDKLQLCIQHLYRNQIDPLCSYGWPHIMRGNSLLLIGNQFCNMMLCLPTICSTVHVCIFRFNADTTFDMIFFYSNS